MSTLLTINSHSIPALSSVANPQNYYSVEQMEPSWVGQITSENDALVIVMAASQGLLGRLTDCPSVDEMRAMAWSGAVYVWEQNEAEFSRWADGLNWASTQRQGSFTISTASASPAGSRFMKQQIRCTTSDGHILYLVAYISTRDIPTAQRVADDPLLGSIRVPPGFFTTRAV
ncbi:hypothetical protein BT69DRAFT_1347558 [Atractiella rhizophila]|nr:hypothetical protein BT69DRAFT_1354276 [Atractiella rhizophila]KAH8927027.1 hypothetical protein BT69DRAFT_1347558 [Atractiella rhizophila]